MIWFNGKSGDDFNLYVERYPSVIVPTRKNEKISVPGRNGDLLIQQDAFENVIQRYEIYISAEKEKLPNVTHRIAEWLCVKGYKRLVDSYFLDTFRLAAFQGGIEIENVLNRFGRATIEFDCKPQRWFNFGDQFVDVTNGQTLLNPSTLTAKPLLVTEGSGEGTLTINDNTLTMTDTDNMTIDCDSLQIYRDGVSQSETITGEFFELPEGESTISWTGGITSVRLKPRWWTI